jgi:hypothetical protein
MPEAVPEAEPAEAPDTNGGAGLPIAALLLIIPFTALATGGAYYIIMKKKGATTHEKTDDTAIGSDADGGTRDPGSGG